MTPLQEMLETYRQRQRRIFDAELQLFERLATTNTYLIFKNAAAKADVSEEIKLLIQRVVIGEEPANGDSTK